MVTHPDPWRQSALHKPLTRGWLHTAMIPVAIGAGIGLVVIARPGPARVVAGVFVVSAVTMFVTSAFFNRVWMSDVPWQIMRQIDQSAIYLLITGTFTGLVGVSADDEVRVWRLVVVWALTLVGIGLRWAPFHFPRGVQSSLFVALSVVAFSNLHLVVDAASDAAGWLVAVGGLIYLAGVLVLGFRRPNPWPGKFGYHEIWHGLVVVALTLHYLAVAAVLT